MANKDFMDPELTEEEKEDMIIKNEEDADYGCGGCFSRLEW